jgi:hypothetical protein
VGICRHGVSRLCRDAADLGRVRGKVEGDLQPADDFPELDLSARALSWFPSQSSRRSADVLTINRPDGWINTNRSLNNKNTAKYPALFQSPKRQSDYQGHRAGGSDRVAISMPVLIGAAMIATAILLSTLITAVGTRFVGMESPDVDSLWLIDRLTGSVYKCAAPERGRAACDAEIATGSIGERPKR